MRPVKKLSVSDEIIDQIKEAILEGRLKSGDKLPTELELTEELNASRTSVREALKALSSLSLIERSNEGTYVAHEKDLKFFTNPLLYKLNLNNIDLSFLIEVRKILEIPMAGLAAMRHSEEDLDRMEEAINRMKLNVSNESDFSEASMDFHLAIASATKNPLLYDLAHSFLNIQKISNAKVMQTRESMDRSILFHEKIYQCIKNMDVEQAKKLNEEHICDVELQLKDTDSKVGKGKDDL